MPRYRIVLEYDGGQFCGWQRQVGGNSAQETVERAIEAFSGEKAHLTAAGRTDAGVHAFGQSAHFDLAVPKPPINIKRGINFHLRKTLKNKAVAVTVAEGVDKDFDARFSAVRRYYRYFILCRRPSPLLDGRAWCLEGNFDSAAMAGAAASLQGHHDFSAFRSAGCQAKSPVKTLERLAAHRRGDWIIITAAARSFLYNQVRIMASTLLAVGAGRLRASRVRTILKEGKRVPALAPAPPCGLYLWRVSY